MIKFFRRIRFELMESGKTGRYLKYAIGEILLVVIGILIALQINNWNENSKLEDVRQNYYTQLIEDLDAETKNLNDRLLVLEKSIASYEAFLKVFDRTDLEAVQLIESMAQVDLTFQYLSFNTNTIETLEATGDIKLIPTDIRKSLIALRSSQELLADVSEGNDNIYLEQLQRGGEKGYNSLAMRLHKNPTLQKEFLDSYDVYEMVSIMKSAFRLKNFSEIERIATFRVMLDDIKELKEAIKAEQD